MSLTKIHSLKDVPAWQICCGCGACAYLYPEDIQMLDISAYGRRPSFKISQDDHRTYQQGLDICPGIALSHQRETLEQKRLISSLTKTWGPIFEVWEVYATDPEIRYKGSSGGTITALALYCLEHEGMEGVLHVKADPDRPYLNTTVLSKDRDELIDGVGSRYSPASPCEKLGLVEQASQKCVVIGKPCDIAAANNVIRLKPQLEEKIGLTIACFCAGTPSTNGTMAMLKQMGVQAPENLGSLRYRGYGWPGSTKAELRAGIEKIPLRELQYSESWGEILQKYRQWRCYICPDHTGEFADIAIGDPWYKEREDCDEGRSLILVRSVKGKEILERAIASRYLVAEQKEEAVLLASQPNLKNTRARLWGQLFALKLCGVPCPNYNGFSLFTNWYTGLTIARKVKSVLGTVKRVFVKKLHKRQR